VNHRIVLCDRLATIIAVGYQRLFPMKARSSTPLVSAGVSRLVAAAAALLLATGNPAQAASDTQWTALGHGPCGVVDGKAYCLNPLSPFASPRLVGQQVVRVHGGESVVCGVTPNGEGVCGDASTSSDAVRVAEGASNIAGVFGSGAWCASLLQRGALCGRIETLIDGAQLGAPPIGLPDAQRYVAVLGGLSSCALTDTGKILCWGAGRAGLLGRGDSGDATPTPIAGEHRYKSIAGGERVWCGLVDDGTVRCWGDGRSGVLGNPDSLDRCATADGTGFECAKTPRQVRFPSPASQIDVAPGGVCALLIDQRVACRGSSQEALVIEGLPRDITEIGVGNLHGCARSATGDLWCWFLTSRRPVPQKVARP